TLQPVALLASGKDVYAGGVASYSFDARTFVFLPVAHAPSMIKRSATNFVVLHNPDDGYEVTHFRFTGITDGACYQSDGRTPVYVGDFITVQQGETGLIFEGATNGSVTAVSCLNATINGTGTASTTLNFGVPQGPVFSLSGANYSISENSGAVRVTVQKWGGGAASVNLTTADGTAVAYDADS